MLPALKKVSKFISKQKAKIPELVSNLNKNYIPAITAAGLAGGAATNYLLSNNDQQNIQIPLKPTEAEQVPIEEIPKTPNTIKDVINPAIKASTQKQQIVNQSIQPASKSFVDEEFQKAQDLVNQNQSNLNRQQLLDVLGTSLLNMGAGGAREVKSNLSPYLQKLQEMTNAPIQQLKTKRQFESDLMQLNLEKQKNDVNSEISNLYRSALKKLDPSINVEGMTASQVEKAFPTISQAINAVESRELKKILAEQTKENKKDSNLFKERDSIDKIWKNIQSGDNYKSYSTIDGAIDSLLYAVGAPGGDEKKLAAGKAFASYAKIAQGDQSVLRENDIRLLAGNMGYTPSQMIDKLSAKAVGGNFTDSELNAMMKVLNVVKKSKAARLANDIEPLQKRANKIGYDLSESIPTDFLNNSKNTNVKRTVIFKSGEVVNLTQASIDKIDPKDIKEIR